MTGIGVCSVIVPSMPKLTWLWMLFCNMYVYVGCPREKERRIQRTKRGRKQSNQISQCRFSTEKANECVSSPTTQHRNRRLCWLLLYLFRLGQTRVESETIVTFRKSHSARPQNSWFWWMSCIVYIRQISQSSRFRIDILLLKSYRSGEIYGHEYLHK